LPSVLKIELLRAEVQKYENGKKMVKKEPRIAALPLVKGPLTLWRRKLMS